MRKLATVRMVTKVTPIEGADLIELVKVGGWSVVCKRGDFHVGEVALYLEIDSFVPQSLAPFLSDKPKTYQGTIGNRLRTKRLRGVLSQGLLLPMQDVLKKAPGCSFLLGDDLTDTLGIKLWERPIPAQLSGQMKGSFPYFIPKTDQERIQNLDYSKLQDDTYYVTEKLDGSSMTVYQHEGVFGICSRNVELKPEDDNAFCNLARRLDLQSKITIGGYAIQGEMVGPGIQKNQYNLSEHKFFVYDIFDIINQTYLSAHQVRQTCISRGLNYVPVIHVNYTLPAYEGLLEEANGISELSNSPREGLVFVSESDPNKSFKVISNNWLLKNE